MRLAGGEVPVKFVDIGPEGRTGIQAKPVGFGKNGVFAEGGSEREEGAAEGGASTRAIALGPEQIDEGVTRVGLTRDGEIGDKGDSLAPVDLDRRAVALNARRPEQIESQGGRHTTSFLPSVLESRRKVNGLC
jgi:hypothetical protein